MDVFGKTSTETKKMSPLQMELSAKIRERNSQGLGADLTETEEDDDDLLSMFNKSAKSSQQRSQSPYESELRKTPPKPQARVSIGTKDANTKQKVQIKPKNELDRLLMDDNEEADMLSTQKKPWQPPQFKQFSAESEVSRAPQPKERVRSSPLANPRHQSSLLEESEGSDDDELTGAYTRQLQQRTPPLGRKTPTNDGRNSIDKNELQRSISGKQGISGSGRSTPKSREDGYGLISSGRTTPKQDQLDQIRSERNSPGSGRKLLKSKEDELFGPQGGGSGRTAKSKEDELFGPQRSGSGRTTPKSREDELLISKSKKPSSNLDDIFGKRKSPSDQSLFADRKSPRELERENPERSKFKSKENDSRLTPKSELSERKSSKQSTMDDIFGVKKRVESPLFQSGTQEDQVTSKRSQNSRLFQSDSAGHHTQPAPQQRSYMSKLLADSDEEDKQTTSNSGKSTRISYLDNLLGDEATAKESKPKTRSSFMDNLLADDESDRKSRPRERSSAAATLKKDDDERESSLCRDVDKDPMMIEKKKEEREQKRQSRKGKPQTESQQADFDIEEVSDAQDALAMTYIKPEESTPNNRSTAIKKPKPRKDAVKEVPATPTFESASDIRNYIYKEWMEKKQASGKKSISEKRRQEKEEQQKKEKELLDKKLENEVTFRTWKERKDEMLREKLRKARAEEKKKAEELKKEQEKKRDADLIFKKWKEEKDEDIITKKKREKKDSTIKLSDKQEIEDQKKKDAEGAFVGWKKKKDKEIMQTVRQSKQEEKQQVTQKMNETRQREREAEKLYEKWLEEKEQQKKREKAKARSRSKLDLSPRPAWSPANKTIPYGH